jgi:hypothetical protein
MKLTDCIQITGKGKWRYDPAVAERFSQACGAGQFLIYKESTGINVGNTTLDSIGADIDDSDSFYHFDPCTMGAWGTAPYK